MSELIIIMFECTGFAFEILAIIQQNIALALMGFLWNIFGLIWPFICNDDDKKDKNR